VSSLAPPPVPPSTAPATFSVGRSWTAPVSAGAVALAGTAVLAVANPNTTHIPLCPLNALTGIDCPFCGGLRAVHALTRLDVGTALDHNLLLTASVPALLACWAVWLGRSLGRPVASGHHFPAVTKPLLVAVALLFAVARNIPALAWLGSGA